MCKNYLKIAFRNKKNMIKIGNLVQIGLPAENRISVMYQQKRDIVEKEEIYSVRCAPGALPVLWRTI